MDRITVLLAVGIGVVLSIGILSIAFALYARNADTKSHSRSGVLARFFNARLGQCSFFLIGVGVVLIISAIVLQFLIRREGVLESENVYTLRMPHNLEVAKLNDSSEFAVGEVIATFRSPQHEAELKALELHAKELEAERDALKTKPFASDPRLVQSEQELEAEYRHLRETFERFTLENRDVSRQKLRDMQQKKTRIIELSGVLEELPQEIIQRQAELAVKAKSLARLELLKTTNAVTEQEYDDRSAEVAVLRAEIKKLQAKENAARQEIAQSKHDLAELEHVMGGQAAESDEQLSNLRTQLSVAGTQRAELNQELENDLQAAKDRRKAELAQLQLELEQTKKKFAGLKEVLVVTAPLAGHIAYRNPSPGTVHADDPLVVISPTAGFRFRARLPVAQGYALQKQDSVALELRRMLRSTSDDVELPPQQLVRRFSGKPRQIQPLKDDPAVVLIELSCEPPEEAVRDLALGETVRAELAWTPPFYTLPLFAIGAVPMALGVGGLFIVHRERRNLPKARAVSLDPAPANTGLRQSTPDAAALRMLGEQLAEMIRDEQLDPSLLATVEWALDRHGLNGAQQLANGVRESGSISDALGRLIDQATRNGSAYGCDLFRRQQLIERLISLLRVIAPDEVPQSERPGIERMAM